MPNTTLNYGFKKPYLAENADIAVLNENCYILDVALMVTADQIAVPPAVATKSKLSIVIGWLANRIKAITGKTNWWETPATTLENCYTHINSGSHANATTSINGFMSSTDKSKLDGAVSNAIGSKLIIRDASGRAQVVNPAIAADIANKDYVDTNFVKLSTDSTMSAKVTAQSNTAYTTRQIRNIVFWISGDTPPVTQNGDVLLKIF